MVLEVDVHLRYYALLLRSPLEEEGPMLRLRIAVHMSTD